MSSHPSLGSHWDEWMDKGMNGVQLNKGEWWVDQFVNHEHEEFTSLQEWINELMDGKMNLSRANKWIHEKWM